jgi:hypothetical protein
MKPTYSHSGITFYETCPYGFNRKYNLKERGINNWFAELGSLIHQIHEDYYKVGAAKNLSIEEVRRVCLVKFNAGWELIVSQPPAMMKNIKAKRYQQVTDYFSNFVPDKEITKVEEHIEWTLKDGTKMQCYIDEQVKYNTGAKKEMVGDIKSSYNPKYDEQLNTYCLAFKAKNGKYPTHVYVREYTTGKTLTWEIHAPRRSDITETEKRLMATVKKIESDTEWEPKGEKFFCQNLCGFRNNCKFAVK